MASTDPQAHKARIMAHMNQSHGRELSIYLRHHCGLTSRAASSAKLKEISLDGMIVTAGGSGGKDFTIPFTPPLATFSDVRPRLVAMDKASRQALGLSDIHITAFASPRGFDIVVAAGVALYFFCYFTLPFVVPGMPIWSLLKAVFPGGPAGYHWLVKAIFLPVVGIHLTEAWWFNRTRMAPHGVEIGSALWWMWEVSTFFEGICAFRRFDGLVEKKQEEKAARKH